MKDVISAGVMSRAGLEVPRDAEYLCDLVLPLGGRPSEVSILDTPLTVMPSAAPSVASVIPRCWRHSRT
jgi:hypothetical protein